MWAGGCPPRPPEGEQQPRVARHTQSDALGGAACSGGPRGARLAGGVGWPCGCSPVRPAHSGKVADASLLCFRALWVFPEIPVPLENPAPR